jgi:hypothetical protein
MKIHIGVFILSLLILSCSEEPAGIDNSKRVTINGKWLWVATSGGITGRIITPPPGTMVIHTYTSDGFFSIVRNDTLQKFVRYSIEKQKSNYSDDSLDVIIYHDSTIFKQVIEYLSVDTLSLSDHMIDGFGSLYIRVSKPFLPIKNIYEQ